MDDKRKSIGAVLALIVAVFAVVFVEGCAQRSPWTPGFYSPRNLTRLAGPVPSIAIYLLSDERGTTDPTLFGEFSSFSGRRGQFRATGPISTGVTRALVEGFRARGFPVVDESASPYSWVEGQKKTSVAISGRVLEFGMRIVRSGLFTYDHRIACRVVLELHESASGRQLWTKTYSDVTQSGFLMADNLTVLSWALEHVVEQVVTDAELLELLGAAH